MTRVHDCCEGRCDGAWSKKCTWWTVCAVADSQNSDAGQRPVDTHRVDSGRGSGQEKVSHILRFVALNESLFVRVGHVTSTDQQPTLSVKR